METGKIVVVGGGGMVGRELLEVLEDHEVEPSEIAITGFSSVGRELHTPYGVLPILELTEGVMAGAQFIFFAAGANVSRKWIPRMLGRGHRIIDLSSAFRYEDSVPLVIPPINGEAIEDSELIACPNCTTSIALMALAPIYYACGINRVNLVSYQAASGAGKEALDDLDCQIEEWARTGHSTESGKTAGAPLPLAGNLIPRIDVLSKDWNGFTKEEMKTHWESNKILFERYGGPEVFTNATCVRVPVRRCHSEALTVELEQAVTVEQLRNDILGRAFGVKVIDDAENWSFPMPLNMEGKEEVGVGRIRLSPDKRGKEIMLWVCGDQLLRGAALTAVEILEYIMGRRF